MYLYTDYVVRLPPSSLGRPLPGQVVVAEGIQTATPQMSVVINQYLANLFLAPMAMANLPEGAIARQAVQCQQANAAGAPCSARALEQLRAEAGVTAIAHIPSASPQFVQVITTTNRAAAAAVATPDSDFAVIDLSQAVMEAKPEKKVDTSMLLVGAAGGGALGWTVAGPLGAAAGAVGGAAVAKWLA